MAEPLDVDRQGGARRRAAPAARGRRAAAALAPRGGRAHGAAAHADDRRRTAPTAVFIQDRDTSDVWLLDLEAGAPPERLTTGREPAPYWEDTQPRGLARRLDVAYADEGQVWLVPAAGGPPRRLVEGASPVWLDDDRLVDLGRARRRHAARGRRRSATRGRAGSPRSHGELEQHGDEGEAAVSPDGAEVAYVFSPRADLNRSEIRVVDARRPARCARSRARRGCTTCEPAWSPDGATIAYTSERSGWYEIHLVGADGADDRQLTDARGRPRRARLAPRRRSPRRRCAAAATASTSWWSTPSRATARSSSPRAAPGARRTGPPPASIVAGYEDHATPPELRRRATAASRRVCTRRRRAPSSARRTPCSRR